MNEKIPCRKCGAMILQSTARRTCGVCMPCKIGFRKAEPKTKLEAFKRKFEAAAFGTVAAIALVLMILVIGLVKSPQSSNLLSLANATISHNFYLDESFDSIDGNSRIVVSIQDGKVDFLVFTTKEKSSYPKFAGTVLEGNQAVGYIMLSPHGDSINITNTNKVYEIGSDKIIESNFGRKMTHNDFLGLVKLLGGEFSIDKFHQIKDKI